MYSKLWGMAQDCGPLHCGGFRNRMVSYQRFHCIMLCFFRVMATVAWITQDLLILTGVRGRLHYFQKHACLRSNVLEIAIDWAGLSVKGMWS